MIIGWAQLVSVQFANLITDDIDTIIKIPTSQRKL